MEKRALYVSIIGGGIGGLAAAFALQPQGIQVAVFERNPELREIGAGLTLSANGVRVALSEEKHLNDGAQYRIDATSYGLRTHAETIDGDLATHGG
jgi:salicylate hydroxylase